jgi:5-methylcytosine-specific restriction endonuclease McrA
MVDEVWMYECPGCGMVYDRAYGTGIHTHCENQLATERLRNDPVYMMGYRWNKIRNKVSPIVFAWDQYRCQDCGAVTNLTVDHVTPISKGGTNEPDNLQTLCGSCNSRKGAR